MTDDELVQVIEYMVSLTARFDIPDLFDWASEKFYIVETKRPIVLQPVQVAVLTEFFRQDPMTGKFIYSTALYSTIKKSGKTTIAALAMQWATECWGDYGEIYHMGNKLGQAKERGFKIVRRAVELSPYVDDWEITATRLTHRPTHSFIAALPVSAAGEAGANSRFTGWTELHGYTHEEEERMWSEMQPVPTQPLSYRFVESYAGYDGESTILQNQWHKAKPPEDPERYRIHDEYPIYANPDDGWVAYIDQGVEARRMPWQTPDYYRKAEREELPHEFKRIHLNEWVTSRAALINVALWDRLEGTIVLDEPARTDVVLAADASVSGDCTALAVVAYVPAGGEDEQDQVRVIKTFIWEPDGEKLDYHETLKPAIEECFATYRVIGVAYDEYQLHDFMTQMSKSPDYAQYARGEDERKAFWYAFPQGSERLKSDTALLKRIQSERLVHDGDPRVRQHVQNADAKASGTKAIRIVKRGTTTPVDAIVAISMGAWRAHYLYNNAPDPVGYGFGHAIY